MQSDIFFHHVLPNLSIGALIACSKVCKQWNIWIKEKISNFVYRNPSHEEIKIATKLSLNKRSYEIRKIDNSTSKPIVMLNIGRAGYNLGRELSQRMCLDNRELEDIRSSSFFDDPSTMLPRSIWIDSETEDFESIPLPKNAIVGKQASVIYPNGYANKLRLEDTFRRVIENEDSIQGFLSIHSMDGGTGSGTTVQVFEYIRDEYPKSIIFDNQIYASQISSKISSTYDTILSISHMNELIDMSLVVENECASNIFRRMWYLPHNINKIISPVLSLVSSPLRCSNAPRNRSLQEYLINMDSSRLKYLTASVVSNDFNRLAEFSPDHFNLIFKPSSALATLGVGQYTKSELLVRSSTLKMLEVLDNYLLKAPLRPEEITLSVPNTIKEYWPINGIENFFPAHLFGHTGIYAQFETHVNHFNLLFNKRAFLHHYKAAGILVPLKTCNNKRNGSRRTAGS